MAKQMDLRSLDEGRLRHPLFGMREKQRPPREGSSLWQEQRIPKGWWTKSLRRAADRHVRKELVSAVEATLRKIDR